MMDETKKRTLAVMAAILAERRLSERAAEGDSLRLKVIHEAIQNAERILNTLDARWPRERIPGKT